MTFDHQPVRQGGYFYEHVRASAFTLAIGGGLMLYFGVGLGITARANATPEDAQAWFRWNTVLVWALRVVGLMLLGAAALAMTGRPMAALAATIADSAFALVAAVMAVSWTVQARAAGGSFDASSILMALLALMGIHGALTSWRLYRAASAGAATFRNSDSGAEQIRHE